MKKIRPYRGVYKIPTHRHNKKRYRQSHWELSEPWWGCPEPLNTLYLVTDLQRVPKRFDNRVLCYDDGFFGKANFRKMTKEEVDEFINSKGYELRIEPTKKLGIFQNIWQNKIRRGK